MVSLKNQVALRAGFLDFVLKSGDYLAALQEAVQRASERLGLEAQVTESKARLAGIVSSAMDAIILLDEELRITMFNPAAEELFEISATEATGQPLARFLPDLAAVLIPGLAATAPSLARPARAREQ